jgi:hypothetical protein
VVHAIHITFILGIETPLTVATKEHVEYRCIGERNKEEDESR